jgi:hypothetical protein
MMTKKFRDLEIGDLITTEREGAAKVLSCPSSSMARGFLGVEIRLAHGGLKWCAMRPETEVFLIEC